VRPFSPNRGIEMSERPEIYPMPAIIHTIYGGRVFVMYNILNYMDDA